MNEVIRSCVAPLAYPKRIENRPGLDRVAYRLGTFAEFREALMRRIDLAPELAAWTHRTADDPGIALLEGAAIVADVLTLYQELYANEAWLRTAQWRQSVSDLVRLLGYRLSPTVAGRATFALVVTGTTALPIPAEFPIKADLADVPDPAEFETTLPVIAYPHLSRFHLYRPRTFGSAIAAGSSRFELEAVAGDGSGPALRRLDLKKGDRLMLAPPEPAWLGSGAVGSAQETAQVVVVTKVTDVLDRRIVEIEGSVSRAWVRPMTAYRINRTFRHFGFNAPNKIVSPTPGTGAITGSSQSDTSFDRHTCHDCTLSSFGGALPPYRLPLDQEVGDLSLGASVIVQMPVTLPPLTGRPTLTMVRGIGAVAAAQATFGSLSGASTLLDLTAPLVNTGLTSLVVDIREVRIYEVTSPGLTFRPVAAFPTSSTAPLNFYGTQSEAVRLAGRALAMVAEDGRELHLTCSATESAFVLGAGAADVPQMWPVTLDHPLAPFVLADFEESAPRVTVYGNLVDATQGKSARDVILGSGDDSVPFQTFKLPKAPLTFHLSSGVTPPEVPALRFYVDGRLWQQVDSWFGQGPEAEVYIVREGTDGNHVVQTGDGRTGRRASKGVNNVMATYRVGAGAHGPVKPGSPPSAGTTPPGLETVRMMGVVAGGADREAADKAREAAPGRVQGLGRLVSVRDFETEVLAIPGVTATAGAWTIRSGIPMLVLQVLLAGGREAEFEQIRQTIAGYQHCRGPDRFPLRVEQALLRYIYLDLVVTHDPRRRAQDIEPEVRHALGLAGDAGALVSGLFGLRHRHLGDPEYASRISGTVQQVPGVRWCRVIGLGLLPVGSDPVALTPPPAPRPVSERLVCGGHELLQLHPSHLDITLSADTRAEECA